MALWFSTPGLLNPPYKNKNNQTKMLGRDRSNNVEEKGLSRKTIFTEDEFQATCFKLLQQVSHHKEESAVTSMEEIALKGLKIIGKSEGDLK